MRSMDLFGELAEDSNKISVKFDIDFNDEIDLEWRSYTSPLHTDLLDMQKKSLITTGLFLDKNKPLRFLYNSDIAKYEDLINELYKELKVVDHEVAIQNEIFYTNKIEGATTTIARTIEIHNGAKLSDNSDEAFSERMIRNGFSATKYLSLCSSPFTKSQLLKLWGIIVDGVCLNEEIRGTNYRTGAIRVGNHYGVEPSHVEDLMNSFIEFYNGEAFSNHPLIKACLLHYAFEYIHPFCDGNGRTGRMLMSNFLINGGYENFKAVSFSYEIDKVRLKYDAAFSDSENDYNDCTPFILFMLQIMYNSLYNVING